MDIIRGVTQVGASGPSRFLLVLGAMSFWICWPRSWFFFSSSGSTLIIWPFVAPLSPQPAIGTRIEPSSTSISSMGTWTTA